MASVLQLHLQYRLWIAEMNAYIDVLRIFDDYLASLKNKESNTDTLKNINNYKTEFLNLRQELDELRHEMHLVKMKLAALAKDPQSPTNGVEEMINHKTNTERQKSFRKKFSTIRKEFNTLETVE